MPISRNHYASSSVVGVVEVILFSFIRKNAVSQGVGGGRVIYIEIITLIVWGSLLYGGSGNYRGVWGAASKEEL